MHGLCGRVPLTGELQLNVSFLFNFNPLLPDSKTQSQALILSSFADHREAQESKFQKLQKPHGSIKMNAGTGG